MSIVRRTGADIDKAELLAELATRPRLREEEIDAQAIEDGDAWTDEELADAEPVFTSPSPDQVRVLRARLGLTQGQFARRFGFTLDTVQQYEQGRRRLGASVDAASSHRNRSGSGRPRTPGAQGRLSLTHPPDCCNYPAMRPEKPPDIRPSALACETRACGAGALGTTLELPSLHCTLRLVADCERTRRWTLGFRCVMDFRQEGCGGLIGYGPLQPLG
jgi:putative transcriptional regulator